MADCREQSAVCFRETRADRLFLLWLLLDRLISDVLSIVNEAGTYPRRPSSVRAVTT
jgi:hypothetical protein